MLAEDGIVRQDITSSFGSSTTTADGVPLTIGLELVDVAGGGTPLAGAAVYLWHCDRDGQYSVGDGSPVVTSQVALPEDVCTEVFSTDGYSQSVRNLSQVSLSRDNVFGEDEGESQLAAVSGSVGDGYTAVLTVGV